MAGIQQTEFQRVAGEGELRCHRCGAGNPEHSIFCSACGYYLRKRVTIAILISLTAATVIIALLILAFKEELFWQLLAAILIGISGSRWILLLLFGFRGERHEEWKARRRKKRELTG